jgi:hypothetical protein
MNTGKSEVARLREQIALEYQAAHRALHAPAQGAAVHQFISARLERMGELHQDLQKVVGEQEATKLLVQTIEEIR